MRPARLAAILAIALTIILPSLVAGRSVPTSSPDAVEASHIGGALLLCGQVTEYTAPDGVSTDGAMTMVGVSQPDPHSFTIAATATVSPGDSALLTAIAAADSFTCLDAVGDGMGVIVEMAILSSAQFCGSVEPAGTTWRLTDIDFPDLTTTLTAEAEQFLDDNVDLDDLLGWFDQFDSEACLTFTTDAGGVVVDITVDGELLVCGDVMDTSVNPSTAVLESGTGQFLDEAVRPDIVGLAGITLPASLFTDAALGLMEIAYAGQTFVSFDGFGQICASIPVETTELLPASLTSSSAGICGWYGAGAKTILAVDAPPTASFTWAAIIWDPIAGFEAVPGAQENLASANFIGDPSCLFASVEGGAGDEVVEISDSIDDCADVVARSADTITLRIGEGQDIKTVEFFLTPGSDIDAALVAGTTSEISLTAFGGAGGPVVIEQTSATCDGTDGGGAGELPDTAVGHAGTMTAGLVGLVAVALTMVGSFVSRRRRS